MPHFFFDLSTPDDFEPDSVGVTFPSLEAAYLSANQAAVDMSIELLRERKDPSGYRFDVRDQDGRTVMEIPFSEVLNFGRNARPRETARLHDRLQAALDRSRRLRGELTEALTQARARALEGLALAEAKWSAEGDAPRPDAASGEGSSG